MKQISICLTDDAIEKIERVAEYYCLPVDMLIQKNTIDRIDEQFDSVVVAAKRVSKSLKEASDD